MPRKRLPRPLAEPVAARLGERNEDLGLPVDVRCGNCGYALLPIVAANDRDAREVGVRSGDLILGRFPIGWRWDGTAWRPTKDHIARRHRLEEALGLDEALRPAWLPRRAEERARRVLRGAVSTRRDDGHCGGAVDPVAFRLPAIVACPRCPAENEVRVGS